MLYVSGCRVCQISFFLQWQYYVFFWKPVVIVLFVWIVAHFVICRPFIDDDTVCMTLSHFKDLPYVDLKFLKTPSFELLGIVFLLAILPNLLYFLCSNICHWKLRILQLINQRAYVVVIFYRCHWSILVPELMN